jgi:predicted metal-dependent hydrolase
MLQLPLNLEPTTANLEPRTTNIEPRTLNPEPGTRNPPNPVLGTLVFVRHPRARRYLIRVTDDGTVRVTIPRRGSQREAAAFAAREQAWIDKQLRARRTKNGALDSNDERQKVDRELIVRARRELPLRLLELASAHGLTVSRISIRNQRWRWGSCSRSGHICLNWRLVTMPDDVRDYVLIHELMHLKRMDHSPKFWKLVAAACPQYQDARRWLRKAARA